MANSTLKELLREYIKEQKFTSSDDILKSLKQLFSDVLDLEHISYKMKMMKLVMLLKMQLRLVIEVLIQRHFMKMKKVLEEVLENQIFQERNYL